MIEITENIIIGSIIYQLKKKFGTSYKYYDTLIEEGFERPSFYVYRVNGIHKGQYNGKEYRFKNDNYIYVIRYFPNIKSDGDITGNINDRIDDLKEVFEYLEIVNIIENEDPKEDPEVYTSYNHINNIEYRVEDNVLQFQITFDVRTLKKVESEKVRENYLSQFIK